MFIFSRHFLIGFIIFPFAHHKDYALYTRVDPETFLFVDLTKIVFFGLIQLTFSVHFLGKFF